jgi:hypothetical protein
MQPTLKSLPKDVVNIKSSNHHISSEKEGSFDEESRIFFYFDNFLLNYEE